jgi:hypothetical protein
VRWAAATVPQLAYPRLSRTLRVLGAAARDAARRPSAPPAFKLLADQMTACRSDVERAIAQATSEEECGSGHVASTVEIAEAVARLFGDATGRLREPDAWTEIITAARGRLGATEGRELADVFDGREAATQLARLATRVSDLTRSAAESEAPPAVIGTWPAASRCGLSLYRPLDLDKLAESNYLHLRFSRDLHWTALLTAVDLINNHARMLWRLVESQLTAAPLEARYQLMRRLAGERALTGRHADQLRALSAPDALFLTIEPIDVAAEAGPRGSAPAAGSPDDPIISYCVRLNSLDRSSAVLERRNPVTRERLERVLTEIDAIGADTDAPPERTLQRLTRCGSVLGDDILHGISDRLAEVTSNDGRPVHLVLQVPRALMRYPWELLRDRRGWLIERFAIGRQVIAEADSVPRWSASQRHGALRLLVVAPAVEGIGAELAGVGVIEGGHVASCFERLQESLPGLVERCDFRAFVDVPVTVEGFRALLREGRYDIVHFAGHGRYDAEQPERSCWMFSDGALYAFELRHTLANAEVTPWLLYGSACEGSRESGAAHSYHDGVYGMASAALGQGVAAYVGPLWKVKESDAKNLAAAFYTALLLRRTSIGEALALARRCVKEGRDDIDEPIAPDLDDTPGADGAVVSAGWTGMVLYGDPTPTVLQRLSPSESVGGPPAESLRNGDASLPAQDDD